MADTRLNETGLRYFFNRIKTIFPSKTEFDALSDTVEELVTEGGEPNKIDTVKVNGTALVPDAQKAVDVTVPTKVSELTNDGDGTTGSAFATEDYVDTNGGKIDKIKVNGTEQTITNKAVDLTVPTKVSDVTNDSGFQTEAEVEAIVQEAIGEAQHLTKVIVATLPATGQDNVLYLVPDDKGGSNKDMYLWVTNEFVLIGNTETDLTGYWNETNLTPITTAQIDAIIDGD